MYNPESPGHPQSLLWQSQSHWTPAVPDGLWVTPHHQPLCRQFLNVTCNNPALNGMLLLKRSGQIQATLNPPGLVKVQRLPLILCLYRLFSLWEPALLMPSKVTIGCDIIPVSLHLKARVQPGSRI